MIVSKGAVLACAGCGGRRAAAGMMRMERTGGRPPVWVCGSGCAVAYRKTQLKATGGRKW
jgi:hypothetical protein